MTGGKRSNGANAAGVRAVLSVAVIAVAGCATGPRLSLQAERYRLEVQMDPVSHRLTGRTEMNLVRPEGDNLPVRGPVSVEVSLHPDL